ncbi:unnamed protein product, partial [Timema podura]|nr:unnamed protein product [Timema podura]
MILNHCLCEVHKNTMSIESLTPPSLLNNYQYKDVCYLDHAGATLYAESQIEAVSQDLCNNVYGNPHSLSLSSRYATDVIDQIRYSILHHFKTNPEEYSLIFTSSATAALKVVAETFDWTGQDEIEKTKDNYEQSKGITHNADIDENNECVEIPENESLNVGKPVYDGSPGVFVYLQDNHTSVLGMRELAANKCKQTHCISHNDIFQELNSEPEQENSIDIDTYSGNSLFVYPAQCNFSGVKYPLEWISQTQNGALNKYIDKNASVLSSKRTKWFCMLDAASFVSTNRLDLSSIKPDFVCVSFYKIFGYPTGLGALLVKNSSSDVLKKSYFGGGTVLIALSSERYHVPRPTLSDRFEDGTLPFLSILALRHGFDTLKQLCGSIEDIAMHTFSLAQSLFLNLISLHHSNGAPAVVLYTDTDYQNIDTQGGIVNFNLLRANGEYVGFVEVIITFYKTVHNILVDFNAIFYSNLSSTWLTSMTFSYVQDVSVTLELVKDTSDSPLKTSNISFRW